MAATEAKPSLFDAVRAFGVMLGGSALLVGTGAASVASFSRALVRRRRPTAFAVAGTGAVATYITVIRRWLLNWGASEEEMIRTLPCDDTVPDAGMQTTRVVTVDAPVEEVWRWLAQIGQDRGGFYSYEWLENLAGCRMRNADRVHSEWQERTVGETVKLHWASGLKLARFDPPHAYCFEHGWFVVLEPEGGQTRLIARGRFPPGAFSLAYSLLLELPHFLMERKMLLGIKERAERARREAPI
jgi:hypothetical protein